MNDTRRDGLKWLRKQRLTQEHRWIGLALLAALGSASSAHAFDTLDNNTTRWNPGGNANPTYSIGRLSPNLPEVGQVNAIEAAFAAWSNVNGVNLRFSPRNNDGDITINFLNNWPREFGRYAAGVTVTSRFRGRIRGAEVSFNEQNFSWSLEGNAVDSDVQSVATHEFGHAIGFGHSFYRQATMYWTGTDIAMRRLSPDDERGARFLYGNGAGGGLMCDTCTSSDDCAPGGVCARLASNRAYCGQSCAGGCPAHSECYELRNGGTACFPTAGDCSDEAAGMFGIDDYCFGSDQCGANARCIPLEDSAICARTCRPGQNDCPTGRCMRTGDNEGVCLPGGPTAFGEQCAQNTDCQSLLCIPVSENEQLCTVECTLRPDNCPQGRCIETGVADFPSVCVPPGSLMEGQACEVARDRCADGLTCVPEGANEVCRAQCPAFGQCADAQRACTPLSAADWYCRPTTGADIGQDCSAWSDCRGGLLCAAVGPQNMRLCVLPCQVGIQGQCANASCMLVNATLGGCSPGNGRLEAPCGHRSECLGGACVPTENGQICSQVCGDNLPCPAQWDCLRIGTGESVCFPPNNFANTDPEANGNGNLPGSGSNDPPGDGSTPSNPSNQEPGTGQSNTGSMPEQMNQSGSGTPNASTGSTNTPNGSPAPAPVGGQSLFFAPSQENDTNSSGCACRTDTRQNTSPWSIGLLVLIGLWRVRMNVAKYRSSTSASRG